MNSPAGLFGSDRLRPSAGMANIVIGRSGFRADASGDLAAVGPAILRSFVAERRTWLSGHDTGREQIALPARDRGIGAARRLNEHGFAVGDAITDDGAARDVAAASAADNRLQGD